ncbi:MAG: hypothetical protein LBB51_02980 [Zoogloeaceae bacterium]|nr:hypothetical protein [Zoogloeaceae bacterium]
MWWFTDFWNDSIEYWQRSWQAAAGFSTQPFDQAQAQSFAQLLAQPFTLFSPFALLGGDGQSGGNLTQSWAQLLGGWQMPRVEAQIEPLATLDPFSGERIGELMRLSMQIFMPWASDSFHVEALVSRGEKAPAPLAASVVETLPPAASAIPALPAKSTKRKD